MVGRGGRGGKAGPNRVKPITFNQYHLTDNKIALKPPEVDREEAHLMEQQRSAHALPAGSDTRVL